MLKRVRDSIMLGDLHHLGRAEAIATYVVPSDAGVMLVDPGPSVTREALEEVLRLFGASVHDVRHVLLTHIHLDHAGISGTLARELPKLRVYVHLKGAPHVVDPSRLLASATRIYGDQMDRLWGAVEPVPLDQLHVIRDRERLTIGHRVLLAQPTPGHAVHHLAFLDEQDGAAFCGDVAGEVTQHHTPALPAAPPPDIDLDAWRVSLDAIAAWRPEVLLLTHFGLVPNPVEHMEEMWERLVAWHGLVKESLEWPATDDSRADRFVDEEMDRLTSDLTAAAAQHVHRETVRSSWFGLARYCRTQANPAPA